MTIICVYDKRKDVAQVQQHVAIDLADCVKNHVVPSRVSDADLQYGNIDSPLNIVGKPSDVFEAIQARRALAAGLQAGNSETPEGDVSE